MRRVGIALGVAVAGAALVAGASAGDRRPAASTSIVTASAPAQGVKPTPEQVVQLGTKVEGECFLRDGVADSRAASWELSTVIPRFKHGGSGGEILAPAAARIPRLANAPNPAQGPFKNEWVLEPKILAFAGPAIGTFGGCRVQSFDPLQALTVEQPGPYVFVQYHSSVGWTATTGSVDDFTPQPCAGNDPEFPEPNGDVAPPPQFDDERQWVIEAFCNKTTVTGFYVASTSKCSKADMSKWSGFPYINQYDAGARLGLPHSASDGRKGGNACGPSSLMMAMLSGGPGNLTTLPKAYDETMLRTAAQIAAAEARAAQITNATKRQKATKAARENKFSGPNAVTFLDSLGWKSARVHTLSADVKEMDRTILETMDGKNPVVLSTAFGTNRWGVTGGGHMVAIVGADRRGNFIVNDPAGNYFSSPRGHYGPGACGYRAVYPHFWLLANVTSRWMLELGKRTPPSRPFLVEAAAPYQPDDAAAIFEGRATRATPKYGAAYSVLDMHPGSKDAPHSFYLQDAKGRRSGWIDGRAVSQIPTALVIQDPPGWTDPAAGDESLPKPGNAAPTPRAIVLRDLAPGIKLFVSSKKGSRFALTAKTWQDGAVVATRAVAGTGTGDPAVVRIPR